MNIFGKKISDVVVRKIYVCNAGFVLPALKKRWNRIQSENPLLLTMMTYSAIVIQISVSLFALCITCVQYRGGYHDACEGIS